MEKEDKKDTNSDKISCDTVLTSQVLEYYKKYSQNRQLPKYFSGASTSFKPENWDSQSNVGTNQQSSKRDKTPLQFQESCVPLTMEDKNARPPLVGEDNIQVEPQIVIDNVVDEAIGEIIHLPSPASSVTSNRKLEWDNGADIGYSNAEVHKTLQKSASLPVLNTLNCMHLQKDFLRLTPEGNNTDNSSLIQPKQSSSENSSQNEQMFYKDLDENSSSSTSENLENKHEKVWVHSSSSSNTDLKNPLTASELLQFYKQKIGLPVAESTPIVEVNIAHVPETVLHYTDATILSRPEKSSKRKPRKISTSGGNTKTSVKSSNRSSSCENLNSSFKGTTNILGKKWRSDLDVNENEKTNFSLHDHSDKISKLSKSKPVILQCVAPKEHHNTNDKFIQTSLTRNLSKYVQTDQVFNSVPDNQPSSSKKHLENVQKQNVFYFRHSDTEKEGRTSSLSTQTNSDVVLSKCNSFEYLFGEDYNQNLQNNKDDSKENDQIQVVTPPSNEKHDTEAPHLLANLRRCPPKSDLTNVSSDSGKTTTTSQKNSDTSSKESPLGQLISSKHSSKLIEDIERSIALLQKLMKSKNYDAVTKKHYLKKIINKITDSNYLDDSSGSYDLPRFQSKVHQTTTTKRVDKSSSSETSEKTPKTNESPDAQMFVKSSKQNDFQEKYLHGNIPWIPVQRTSQQIKQDGQPTVDVTVKDLQQRSVNLQMDTFLHEIVPKQKTSRDEQYFKDDVNENIKLSDMPFIPTKVVFEINKKLQERSCFTLTNGQFQKKKPVTVQQTRNSSTQSSSMEHSSLNELYSVPQFSNKEKNSSSVVENSTSEDKFEVKKKRRSWQDEKTRSEEILEQQRSQSSLSTVQKTQENKNSGDHLVLFAKKEREHQLNWISNEISHLSKLKELLETQTKLKNKASTKTELPLSDVIQKPHIEDMKNIKKSTTVYTITTEKPECNCKSKNSAGTASYFQGPNVNVGYGNIGRHRCQIEADVDSKNLDEINFHVQRPQGHQNYKVEKWNFGRDTVSPRRSRSPVGKQIFSNYMAGNYFRPVSQESGHSATNERDTHLDKKKTVRAGFNFGAAQSAFATTSAAGKHQHISASGSSKYVVDKKSVENQSENDCQCCPTKFLQKNAADNVENNVRRANSRPQSSSSFSAYPRSKTSSPKHETSLDNDQTRLAIELKNARLLKTEKYIRDINDSKFKMCIKRYTFEVPIDDHESSVKEIRGDIKVAPSILEQNKQSSELSSDTLSKCIKVSSKSSSSKSTSSSSSCSPECVKNFKNVVCTDSHLTSEKNPICSCRQKDAAVCTDSQVTAEIGTKCSCKHLGQQIQCLIQEECPSTSVTNTSSGKSCLADEAMKSSRKLPITTKRTQTSKITEPFSNNKKLTKADTIYSKIVQTTPSLANNKSENTSDVRRSSSSSSLTTSSEPSSTTTSSSSTRTCKCCKHRNAKISKTFISEGNASNSNLNQKYHLCERCYQNFCVTGQSNPKPYFTNPQHVCKCYMLVESQVVDEKKTTDEELNKLEKQEYCKCNLDKNPLTSDCCSSCNCKIKKRNNEKKGLAYVLTFAPEDSKKKHKEPERRNTSLEEITIKIPNPFYSKKGRHLKNRSSEKLNLSGKEKKDRRSGKHQEKQTLQEYLCNNRPHFVEAAERRRKCLIDLAYMREARCSKYKQLLALTNGIPLQSQNFNTENKPKRLFSSKEIKAITAKNYKRLPEVQQKLLDNREKQLKKANKMLAEIFNKKLRENVLKGKHTLSSSVTIIQLV